ncbi:MAG: hypothetical protein PHG98_04705 [Bacteroidales bacterium]|jgi:thiol-disulfide isomerase/thioredoxin|nr:hypothetical protein [Bacilli bacterium]MCK9321785.1 hypothetical protein [Bacteroidales bacterium]NCC18325.1 hypothetical protein [Bacteroidia bacterium]MDD2576348.1 hypothetical protein [Bacteroidales bacterium]MDD3668354.1 hypothetical protein [Bacteroidales bacterium]
MDKKIIYIFLLVIFVSCSTSNKAKKYWEKEVVNQYNKEYISFKVNKYDNQTKIYDSIIYYVKKSTPGYFAVNKYVKYSILKKDSAKIVDLMSDELILTQKSDSIGYFLCEGIVMGNAMDYYYLFNAENKYLLPSFKFISSQNIDGIKYKILSFDNNNQFTKDESTGEWIQNHNEVSLFVNKKTKLVDRIDITQIENNTIIDYVNYYFSDYNYDNHDSLLSSFFDFNRKEYNNFDKILDERWYIFEEDNENNDSVLNDQFLNYPIVSLDGDTTSIKEFGGWLLLDFWFVGCKPCLESFIIFSEEKQKYGELFLEREGIKVLSINPISSNSNLIRKTIEKFEITDHFYHAKGMDKLLPTIKYMPRFLLVSPDRKIVYNSNKLGDYSEIIKILRSY